MTIAYRNHARCCSKGSHARVVVSEAQAGGRPFAFAGSPRQFERDRPFDVRHLALDLDLDVTAKRIEGRATLDVVRVDRAATEIELDAVGFDLKSVSEGGKPAEHHYDGKVLRVAIPLGKEATSVVVAYSAAPRKGLYFLEPDEHVRDRPRQVWTQCQEEDARHWFPCHDKPHVKMTTELCVRVPSGWYALSNGALLKRETPEGDRPWTYHWKMSEPHPSYLVTLAAGEFTEITDHAGSVPLSYFVPKGQEANARRTFGRTPEMVAFFSEVTGVAYPWNKYAQIVVHDFIFGGMENTTATTMYEHILLDERAALDVTSDDLIAHELAHQWFGDLVTCRDWSEGWLNEGFATFMEHVWREKALGKDEFDYGIRADLHAYTSEANGRYKRPIVCHDYDAPLDLFDRHLYEKGGLVLHMLRLELGAEVFWRGVSAYLRAHQKGLVETRDLVRALETASGRSLGRFFDQWVMKPGHPEVDVDVAWDRGVLTLAVKQHHAHADGVPAAFEFPLVVDVVAKGEGAPLRRERVQVLHRNEVFAIPCKERPHFVVVDPDMAIVGDVRVKAPADMSRAALAHAPTARGRWLAADALSETDDPVTIAALVASLVDDGEFWGVRVEAAEALGRIHAKECEVALRAATSIAHPKVRRAVVVALGRFRTASAEGALLPVALEDDSYLVEADAARSLGKTRRDGTLSTLVDLLDRDSWADVVRIGAIDGLAALRDDRAMPHLVARTRYGHSERVRRAAMMALTRISTDRKTRELIEDLLDDAHPYVRMDAVRALGEIGDAKSRGPLRARLPVELDARVRRRIREVVRDLGGESKHAVASLREEFEKLTTEARELRSRIAKLEARTSKDAEGGEAPKTSSKPPAKATRAKNVPRRAPAKRRSTPKKR